MRHSWPGSRYNNRDRRLGDAPATNPWLPKAVFNAYSEAKKLMYDQLKKMGWANISLPWVSQEIEETRKLMGENFWPYGIEANRKALESLFQYSYEQGLSSRKLTIEELFVQGIC